MIQLINKQFCPNLKIEVSVSGNFKSHPTIFVWEDVKNFKNKKIDKIEITSGTNYFSEIEYSINMFSSDVTFSIICEKTYKVLFTTKFKNLSFIRGKNVLYLSQNTYTGYAYAARNYIHQLLEQGYNVRWEFIGEDNNYIFNRPEEFLVRKCCYNTLDSIDSVIIHHTPEIYPQIYPKYNNSCVYGLTTWESDVLPHDWIKYINILNYLIVPSYFNKSSFNKSVDVPIQIWGHEIFDFKKQTDFNKENFYSKCELLTPNEKSVREILEKNVVYYNISEFSPRKNLEQVLHCFIKKFNKNDDVCLFIKTNIAISDENNTFIKHKILKIIEQYDINNLPNLVFCFDKTLSDVEIQYIHELGDIYFTLNRGEGFGLCTYTAKKIGNKIICGKYGAEREFLNDNIDVLLDYKMEHNFEMVQTENYLGMKVPVYNNKDVIENLNICAKTKKQTYNL